MLNTYYSVIMVDVAFQLGFCTFVLSNYMKALPNDLTEAALVDGCGVWRHVPPDRPAAVPPRAGRARRRSRSSGSTTTSSGRCCSSSRATGCRSRPAINNLKGEFLSDYNLIAAGATITVIPTLVVYAALQRQFVAGLTLGGSKG